MNENSAESTAPRVTHAPDKHRYEISVDGEPAGFTEYADRDNQRVLYSTHVDERFTGRGLGGQLTAFALTHTREAGLRAVPVCPYVAKYVEKHRDFADVVDPVSDEALATARSAQHR